MKKRFENTIRDFFKHNIRTLYLLLTKFLAYSFKLDLFLISFFSDTLIGYCFYLFCFLFGFFSDTNHVYLAFAARLFVIFMIGIVTQTYILVKIPYTKKFLENLVGKDFIEAYLGKYTGSEAVIKVTKYLGPFVAGVTAEVVTSNMKAAKLLSGAENLQTEFDHHYKAAGIQPSLEELRELTTKKSELITQAAHAKGIISRGFAASNLLF